MKLILAIVALTASVNAATPAPSVEELNQMLTVAKAAWGVDVAAPIEFRIESLNACKLSGGQAEVATIQTVEAVTTIRFDDDSPAQESREKRYIIRFNSSCDWSKLNAQQVMTHEYGHLVTRLEYHSQNPRSVMNYIVKRDSSQVILPEDRAQMATQLAGVSK